MTIPLFVLCFAFYAELNAQVILQLETRGNMTATKIFPGDIIYVKLTGEKFWREAIYIEANPISDMITFSFGDIDKKDIRKLLFKAPKEIGKGLKYSLLIYSGSVVVLSPLNLLREDELNYTMLSTAAASAIGAFALPPLARKLAIKRLGKKHWLRILDISLPDGTKSIPDQ